MNESRNTLSEVGKRKRDKRYKETQKRNNKCPKAVKMKNMRTDLQQKAQGGEGQGREYHNNNRGK